MAALVAVFVLQASVEFAYPASAFDFSFGGFSGPVTSLRTPLIPGAIDTPPFACPPEGQPPPTGDGFVPYPVNPGHLGQPVPHPPSHVCLPPVGPLDKPLVDAMLAPYLEPPASTPGGDPGIIYSKENGFNPPVTVTTIDPGGGISGQAPIYRWQGQSSRDYGTGNRGGSSTFDFGGDVDAASAVKRSTSEDGPDNGGGGQTTQDLHGQRTLFKGPHLRPLMTIAPY